MTRNREVRNYGKVCTISGKTFPGNEDNFYVNKNSDDGYTLIIKTSITLEELPEQV